MNVGGIHYRTIWLDRNGRSVWVIDQTKLPHAFETVQLRALQDVVVAIRNMVVRGAPLIGATASYGMALAMRGNSSDSSITTAYQQLLETRPTAINLKWALEKMRGALMERPANERVDAAYALAGQTCDEDVALCKTIGEYGLPLLEEASEALASKRPLNVLTHCNAGWLATVDWGTALAPIYLAHDNEIPIHVWVDETRPRNQGAALTAWELGQHGVPHTVVADNTGGHLMQRGLVDLCITGTDRTAANGDVCNKIGTYLKALAARDNNVPFYVALPSPSIDWSIRDAANDIPIEQRDGAEITNVTGESDDGKLVSVRIAPKSSATANYGFDITPARLLTGLITERGVCTASADGLATLYPEHATLSDQC
ncbi:MAG: S-methyl-5-thioribose-1-phosphate isomerase [Gammaproteobacteria bacterium]|nr:S-methyl-5-thioribose-1-phosphate isomerase [Gammaproteobacteria bacterium]